LVDSVVRTWIGGGPLQQSDNFEPMSHLEWLATQLDLGGFG